MFKAVRRWIDRYFSNEEALILFAFLAITLMVVLTLGGTLGPLFVAIIFAYLLQGLVNMLVRLGVPQMLAVGIVFALFLGLLFSFVFVLMPLMWTQMATLLQELPRMLNQGQDLLTGLPQKYPQLISETQLNIWIGEARAQLGQLGQWLLSYSLTTLSNIVMAFVYLILVPILVFFFLKDLGALVGWTSTLLPKKRDLMLKIWHEMDDQIANYVRGKGIEIFIVGGVSYIAFELLGLSYAPLLGVLIGLSVIVPYIGAAVVTIPVLIISGFQWGWSSEFAYAMVIYAIIQTLDGNLLVPYLFSEVNKLHPVAIIVAVLFFGGLWGMLGVFFAIPLATLVKAIFNAWPRETPDVAVDI